MSLALDHLVVVADSLEQGARWCAETFGIEPGPGGRHAGMGTHNRLFAIGSAAFPRAYLEIIAIDPEAPPPGRPRWFGMDAPALRAAAREQPRLLHWVARTDALDAALGHWAALGLDAGMPTAAARGALNWRIALRPDGTLPCDGALPTLIEWGAQHPSDGMAHSGVLLEALTLRGTPAACAALMPAPVRAETADGAPIEAWFRTPRGTVRLASWRPG